MPSKSDRTGARPVYVVDGARTPFLKARGKPGPFSAADLAVAAGRPLLARQPFAPGAFDEVIAGNTMGGPDEPNIARVAALRLGCGNAVPAYTVHRNCASGMQALESGAMRIASGQADLVLAGGVESMSHAPILFSRPMVEFLADWSQAKSAGERLKVIRRFRPGHLAPVIGLLRGLTDPVVGINMGQTAEKVAHRFGISRLDMDAYAARSQQRLAAAQAAGRLNAELVALYDTEGNAYRDDDGVRPDSSVEKLAKLKPVFDKKFGKVTAGNSSQITDGAVWCVLASEEAVERHSLPVLGRIIETQWAGLDPAVMGLGPVHAATPILQRHGWGLADIDYWEINEAFAGQVLGCVRAWEDTDYCRAYLGSEPLGALDPERLNVDGGAIGLGHPVGASGARIVLHLLQVLKDKNAKRGMAAICIGGGQGGAMLVERP